jgi:two-component system OmpR family response regulator
MSAPALVLVADDDAQILEVVSFALRRAGMRVETASDGAQALAQVWALTPDLVILDVMMPELDGTEVCRRVRASSRVPIIFLSSRDEEIDRIVGLELGADDYVTKPFSPRELVARVRANLRRAAPEAAASALAVEPEGRVLRRGRLRVDVDRFQVWWEEAEVALTATEFGLLRTLLGFPGKVFSRDELIDGAYNEHHVITDRTVDSHIRRLRRKFAEAGGAPVETVHGVGYRLGSCA